ncbi:MAG: fused MFS/spermidine synthase [Candidatus Brocadiaceae bacterium]|nr:fused MFS/spermidine synthase [Candidatus Brocadiaceae bacterium]
MDEDTARRTGPRALGVVGTLFITAACGWMVMQMEILGGRALTPYFGSAVYVVMGSVIGVFLLSLSAGYVLGGLLSGLSASKAVLGGSVAVAGAWFALLPRFIEPVCDALLDAGFDDKWGSLTAAFILFAVPTALLGTVSPTAVRWLTRSAAESGRMAGLVLAFSTLASFAGCLAAAFYLIRLSLRRTLAVSGVALLALGVLVLLHALRRRPAKGGNRNGP